MAESRTVSVDLLQTPELMVGQGVAVDVAVPAKGATGHVWTVKTDPAWVRVIGHRRQPSRDSFGGGGTDIFTLQPLRAGRSTVVFRLGAPWRSEPAEEHALALDVTPPE